MYLLTIRPSCLMFVAIGSVFIQSVRSHPIQANNWVKADQFGDIGSVFIQSVRSHPIQANNWFKADQFGDIISSGSGKLFEKEGHHSLSDPEHVNNNHSPTWQTTNKINELEDQGQPDYYQKGGSSSENPIISVVLPTLSAKIPEKMHKDYTDNMKQKSEHISELEEITLNAIAADRQNRYNEILRHMHTKNTLNREPCERTPTFFSLFSSSGYSVSFFAYRFSIPTLRLKTAGFSQFPLPGVFTTVIILLVMVWIALFTIGLVELGNYLWSRRGQTVVGNGNGNDEDQNFELDELMKMPLRVVAIPGDETRVNSLIQPEYEFLDALSSDSDSESSTSDEDDYRIF